MENNFDYVAVGFGPSNIALAVANDEANINTNIRYVESREKANWFPEMLLPGVDIQHNPHRDLITLRNPRSHYTFLNYLFENNRLMEYLNLGLSYPLRKEYSQYFRWVAEHFKNVDYNAQVVDISLDENRSRYKTKLSNGTVLYSKGLVLGNGRVKNIPDVFEAHLNNSIFHFTEYLSKANSFLSKKIPSPTIAVIGGSQSAIELVLDLRQKFPEARIMNFMRGFGYKLRETSPFTRKVFMPEFVDFFYGLPKRSKKSLRKSLNSTNYSVADAESIQALNLRLYEDKLNADEKIELMTKRWSYSFDQFAALLR